MYIFVLVFLWVIPKRLKCMCRRFGTLCPIFVGGISKKKNRDEIAKYPNNLFLLIPPMKIEQSVPKRLYIKFRRRGITLKKEYNIRNTEKVWDLDIYLYTRVYIYLFSYFLLTGAFIYLLVTWCTNSLTFNNCTFCPHWIYVFCIYLRRNSDLCHLQHTLIGFYNRDEKCLLRGTNWVFK